jgi:hypothetical protein
VAWGSHLSSSWSSVINREGRAMASFFTRGLVVARAQPKGSLWLQTCQTAAPPWCCSQVGSAWDGLNRRGSCEGEARADALEFYQNPQLGGSIYRDFWSHALATRLCTQFYLQSMFKFSFSCVRVMYTGYPGLSVMAQNSAYDWFPLVANGRGTIHPVPGNGPTTPIWRGGPPT